jgi:hypothetical protein
VKFDVLLLVTDARYMKKAAGGLSVSYPKQIHACPECKAPHTLSVKLLSLTV